jgi:nicotinamidase-related amidase
MDNGALGVPNATKDVENMTRFIYDNMEKISSIAVSIDTHNPFQIFHPCWWIDENGNNPPPFTAITLQDLDDGKWRAIINPIASRDYVENLEKDGKKVLVVWTYHCLQGTSGCSLENQFANIVYFHSVAKKSMTQRLVKGQDPLSEMYGIIKPEYDKKNYINIDFLNKIEKFDKIIIGGEAKSHCVLESIKQILEHYQNNVEVTKRIYILEDCMSVIPTFEQPTEEAFEEFKNKYNVNIIKSTDLKL